VGLEVVARWSVESLDAAADAWARWCAGRLDGSGALDGGGALGGGAAAASSGLRRRGSAARRHGAGAGEDGAAAGRGSEGTAWCGGSARRRRSGTQRGWRRIETEKKNERDPNVRLKRVRSAFTR
jgi:hypothetical protein